MVRSIGLALTLFGCATGGVRDTDGDFDTRRSQVEARLREGGVAGSPLVEARRAALAAEVAREAGEVAIDSVELRTSASHETDNRVEVLARVPLDRLLTLGTEREAQRARGRAALAALDAAGLAERARLCGPSIDAHAYQEEARIFTSFKERIDALSRRNAELRDAGQLDEISAMRFDLTVRVRLAAREPTEPASRLALAAGPGEGRLSEDNPLFTPLPPIEEHQRGAFHQGQEQIREAIEAGRPGVEAHRAVARRYDALSRRSRLRRLPNVRFVDVGYEALPYPGQTAEVQAQLAFEIPFGFEARADEKRYRALAHHQRSEERLLVQQGVEGSQRALAVLQTFEQRAHDFAKLLRDADAAEAIADEWHAGRLAPPDRIADLLEQVYDGRLVVLEARARAGHAGCELLAASGVSVARWPRAASNHR